MGEPKVYPWRTPPAAAKETPIPPLAVSKVGTTGKRLVDKISFVSGVVTAIVAGRPTAGCATAGPATAGPVIASFAIIDVPISALAVAALAVAALAVAALAVFRLDAL